jgi:ribosome-associated heat shock protein Hsp15
MGSRTPSIAKEAMRLDKWLWAARFFKTRSLAAEAIDKGHVHVAGHSVKRSKDVQIGDCVSVHTGPVTREVEILGLSAVRGPAPVAQTLYQESEASQAKRAAAAEQRRLAPEPALMREQGRPTKRDRRELQGLREAPGWNARWSASVDD